MAWFAVHLAWQASQLMRLCSSLAAVRRWGRWPWELMSSIERPGLCPLSSKPQGGGPWSSRARSLRSWFQRSSRSRSSTRWSSWRLCCGHLSIEGSMIWLRVRSSLLEVRWQPQVELSHRDLTSPRTSAGDVEADETLRLQLLYAYPELTPSSAVALTLRAVGTNRHRQWSEPDHHLDKRPVVPHRGSLMPQWSETVATSSNLASCCSGLNSGWSANSPSSNRPESSNAEATQSA